MAMLPTTLLTLALLTQARAPAGSPPRPNPYLAQAKVFNQGLEYEKCLQRLAQAARWPSSQKEQVEIELYGGLCSYGAGRSEDAKERFALALQLDPKVALPAFTSPKITELFAEVKQRLGLTAGSGATATTPQPPADPGAETNAASTAINDRPTAPPPPAASAQLTPTSTFEGGRKPWLSIAGKDAAIPASLAVASVAATGAGVFLGVMASSLERQANAATFQADALRIEGQAQTAAVWSNVGYAVAGTALVSAVAVFLISPAL